MVAITAACVVAAAWGLDTRATVRAFAEMHAGGFLAALGLLGVQYGFRVMRFGALLGTDRPRWRRVLAACLVGYAAAFLIPLRLGELVRPWYLTRDGVPLGRGLGAVALERVLDMGALLVLVVLASLWVEAPVVEGIDILRAGRRAAGVAALLGLGALLFAAVAGPTVARRLPEKGASLVMGLSESVSEQVAQPLLALRSLLLTALVWASVVAMVYALCGAFDRVPDRWDTAVAVVAVTVGGTLVLPTPGLLGSFELFCRATLTMWDVPAEIGTALGVVWHLLVVGSAAVGAWLVLVRDGLKPSEVLRGSRQR